MWTQYTWKLTAYFWFQHLWLPLHNKSTGLFQRNKKICCIHSLCFIFWKCLYFRRPKYFVYVILTGWTLWNFSPSSGGGDCCYKTHSVWKDWKWTYSMSCWSPWGKIPYFIPIKNELFNCVFPSTWTALFWKVLLQCFSVTSFPYCGNSCVFI